MHVAGFGIGLVDFWFAFFSVYLAAANYNPKDVKSWIFLIGFVLLALLFAVAWLSDIGLIH